MQAGPLVTGKKTVGKHLFGLRLADSRCSAAQCHMLSMPCCMMMQMSRTPIHSLTGPFWPPHHSVQATHALKHVPECLIGAFPCRGPKAGTHASQQGNTLSFSQGPGFPCLAARPAALARPLCGQLQPGSQPFERFGTPGPPSPEPSVPACLVRQHVWSVQHRCSHARGALGHGHGRLSVPALAQRHGLQALQLILSAGGPLLGSPHRGILHPQAPQRSPLIVEVVDGGAQAAGSGPEEQQEAAVLTFQEFVNRVGARPGGMLAAQALRMLTRRPARTAHHDRSGLHCASTEQG